MFPMQVVVYLIVLLWVQLHMSGSSQLDCTDGLWCKVPMPKRSYFRFPPPTDANGWRLAQLQAARGEHVLMKQTREVFPNQMDFLDGDELFRGLNNIADLHVDRNNDLTPLITKREKASPSWMKKKHEYNWASISNATHPSVVIPGAYDVANINRAPVVMLGYYVFARKDNNPYFTGPHVGEAIINRPHIYRHFRAIKNKPVMPFILLHGANENWGILSTEFPNRTIDWGTCCDGESTLHEILDHPKMVMFLHSQHHNVSHPKLITLPRGVAISWERKRSMLWDLLQSAADTNKTVLAYSAVSAWRHRPYIKQCIESKFTTDRDGFQAIVRPRGGKKVNEAGEWEYYRRMVSARVSIALPGLGYDTFRLWESLTLGLMVVVEKGVGFDKTVLQLWRLPALLVEDFDEVTPELLRGAYVEALYRANARQFEFERLTQSFWWSFIMNVSTSMSQAAIDAKFPPESEDPSFARPRVPYGCGERMERCGPGTKRPPRSSCPGRPSHVKEDR